MKTRKENGYFIKTIVSLGSAFPLTLLKGCIWVWLLKHVQQTEPTILGYGIPFTEDDRPVVDILFMVISGETVEKKPPSANRATLEVFISELSNPPGKHTNLPTE